MNKGIVIYAYNNRKVDYALMACISAGLAKKNLAVPAALITDRSTIDWMKTSNIFDKAKEIFDHIIETDRPDTDNQRRLHDGPENTIVPFINSNRASVYDLSPFNKTLLIDGDFIVQSDVLNNFWDLTSEVLISEAANDIYDSKRLGYHDRYVSDTGIKLYWATTVMFEKNDYAKLFFQTVDHIRENYKFYADMYRFNNQQYRNDISFSVAKHILSGYEETKSYTLPPVLTALDKDILHTVEKDSLKFLVNYDLSSSYCLASIKKQDIHIMNKQSIIRNANTFMEML